MPSNTSRCAVITRSQSQPGASKRRVRSTSSGRAPSSSAAVSARCSASVACLYASPPARAAVALTATCAPMRTAREYPAVASKSLPSVKNVRTDDHSSLRTMTEMRLYDLRVTVERIEGRSVCGLAVGDYFEVTESNRVRIPEGKHFCLYALQSVLPLLPAKQRRLPAEDWLEQDSLVACPDPDERLVMRIERIG